LSDTTSDTTKHPVFESELGAYSWCLHCEKVHQTKAWEANRWQCPACGAGTTDLWPWEQIKEANPNYPDAPKEGRLYPQYGTHS